MKRLTKKRNLDQDLAFKEEAEALLGGQVVAVVVSKEAVGEVSAVVSVKIPTSNPAIGLVQVKLVEQITLQGVQTASVAQQLALQALAAVDQISTSNPAIGPVLMLLALPTISLAIPIASDVEQLVTELPADLVAALLAAQILQELATGHALTPPVAIPTLPSAQNAIVATLLAPMGVAMQLVVAVAVDSEEEEADSVVIVADVGHSVVEAAAEDSAIEEAEDGALEIEEDGGASGVEGVVAVRALILKPLVQVKTKR